MKETRVALTAPAEALPAPAAARPRTWPLVDALRGACLVFMGVAHFGGPMAPVFWQPLGFVSVAEVFFLLSGFVAGHSCARVVARTAGDARPWNVWRRVRRIYLAHLATVLLGGGGLWLLAVTSGAPIANARQWWPALADAPLRTLALGAAMLALPPPLDILPLYVAFVLAVPVIVRRCHAGRWAQVAGVSLALWVVSQLTLGRVTHWVLRVLPGADAPDFDVLAYQLPFVAGVLVGCDVAARGHAGRLRLAPARLRALALAAAGLLVLRRVAGDDSMAGHLLAARPFFGPLRAANFAVLALLAVNTRAWLAPLVQRGPLPLLGRQALTAFAAHAVVLLWLRPWRQDLGALGGGVEVGATAAFLGMMTAVAWWRERSRSSS